MRLVERKCFIFKVLSIFFFWTIAIPAAAVYYSNKSRSLTDKAIQAIAKDLARGTQIQINQKSITHALPELIEKNKALARHLNIKKNLSSELNFSSQKIEKLAQIYAQNFAVYLDNLYVPKKTQYLILLLAQQNLQGWAQKNAWQMVEAESSNRPPSFNMAAPKTVDSGQNISLTIQNGVCKLEETSRVSLTMNTIEAGLKEVYSYDATTSIDFERETISVVHSNLEKHDERCLGDIPNTV